MRMSILIVYPEPDDWWPFDSFIGIMIMLNAITIGVESEAAAMKEPVPVWVQVSMT